MSTSDTRGCTFGPMSSTERSYQPPGPPATEPLMIDLSPTPGGWPTTAYVVRYADGGAYLTITETPPHDTGRAAITAGGYLAPEVAAQVGRQLAPPEAVPDSCPACAHPPHDFVCPRCRCTRPRQTT